MEVARESGTTSAARAAGQQSPFHGYTRLSFFRLEIWQLLIFVLIMVGILFLIFPRHKVLISFYLERGMAEEALGVLSEMLRERPDDPGLMVSLSEIYQQKGQSEESIGTMERAVEKDPGNHETLLKLAILYEWARRPRDAMGMWERIIHVDPENRRAFERLIEYYRYYGLFEREAETILRLIRIEKRLLPGRRFMDLGDESVSERITRDPLVSVLTQELERLAGKWDAERGSPSIYEIVVRLYLTRWSALSTIVLTGGRRQAEVDETLTKCFDGFVTTGQIEMGNAFATRLDTLWHQGVKNRLHMVKVMRWNGLDGAALIALAQLKKEFPGDADVLLALAMTARTKGDLEAAMAAYEDLVHAEPDNLNYRRELADLYVTAKMPRKAYAVYVDSASNSGGRIPDLHQMLDIAAATKDKAIMGDALSRALALRPDDVGVLERVADMCLWIKRPEQAYRVCEKVVSLSGGTLPSISRMVEAAVSTGRAEIIKEAVMTGRRYRPGDASLELKLAEVFLGAGREKEAIRVYEDYLGLRPGDEKARKQLAQLYQWTAQQGRAAELMIGAARLKKGDKVALLEAARSAEEAGLTGQAYHLYRELHDTYPEDADIQQSVVRVASWMNRPDEVAMLWGQMSDKDPQHFEKALNAGKAYLDTEKLDKGILYLERALSLRTRDVSLRRVLARAYGWAGFSEKMIAALESLEALGPLEEEERMTLSRAYLARKDGRKALKHLKEVENKRPMPEEEGIMLAMAHELMGKGEAAIKIYERLAEDHSNNADLLATLGNHALWLKRIDVALRFYELALRKNPKNLIALKGSAQIYAWNNDPEKAMRRFEAYHKLNPHDYETRYQLGELYFENQRRGEAFGQYRRSLALMEKAREGRPKQAPPALNSHD